VFDPNTSQIELTGLRNKVSSASVLEHAAQSDLKWTQNGSRLTLQWPSYLNNEAVTVIALDIEGEPDVDTTQHQFGEGLLRLPCRALNIHGTTARVYYRGHGPRVRVVDWTDPDEYISGTFDLSFPGDYVLQLTYAASPPTAQSRFEVDVNGRRLEHTIISTGGDERFQTFEVGRARFDEPGRYSVTLRPVADGWKGLGLQSIALVPGAP